VIEHLLNHLLQRQFNDVQRRISLSEAIFDKERPNIIILKSTSTAMRRATLQLVIFLSLFVYSAENKMPVAYQLGFLLLLLIGIFLFLKSFFSKALISPAGILAKSFWPKNHELRWCDIDGIGYYENGNSLVVSGLGGKITIGVFSKGIYQAALVIKRNVSEDRWSPKALKWFDGLEAAVNQKK
jgi:hypothetical protein